MDYLLPNDMDCTLPKGYKLNPVRQTLRTKDGVEDVILYGLSNKRHGLNKVFSTIDSVYRFISTFEREKLEKKALRVNGYQAVKGVAAMHKDMEAAVELEQQVSGWLSNQSQPKIDGIYLDNVNRTLGH
jgi:hypothetical protein